MSGTLHWRHNGHDIVSNHQPHDCLLNCLFIRRSKKTSKLRVTGLCSGIHRRPVNSPYKWPVTRKMFPFDDVIMSCPPGAVRQYIPSPQGWGVKHYWRKRFNISCHPRHWVALCNHLIRFLIEAWICYFLHQTSRRKRRRELNHWGWDKMAAILPTTFSNSSCKGILRKR